MDTTTALGKRKERDPADVHQHGITLFVSNLPYSATSTDLQTLFSDIAPVRSAFVVLDQESKVSKGVGYVAFSVKEDAQMAYDQIQKEGLKLVNRALRVQWADNKKKDGEEPKKPSKAPPMPSHPKGPHDPDAVRTLVVSGLPSGIDQKVLWKKFRKSEGATDVKWPVTLDGGKEDNTVAYVLFATPNHALNAMPRLHAHVYKGSILSVVLKKRIEVLSRHNTSKKASAPTHNSRLIIRNLPFDITEQDLRAVFLPFGPVHSIHIPTSSEVEEDDEGNTKTKTKTKGFAFVWMLSRKDAEKALDGCNGKPIKAGSAQQMVLDKQKKKKAIRLQKKIDGGDVKKEEEEDVEMPPAPEEGEGEEDDVEEVPKAAAAKERVMAVDWALSKDKYIEEKAKMEIDGEEEDEDEDSDDISDDSSDSDSDSGSDPDTSDSEALGVHERDTDDEDEEPVKPELPPPATGTTLFIRNVPYEATEDELRTLLRPFGPLRYARITMDYDTGRTRGTGFACFWNIEDADKVVEQSDLLRTLTSAPSDLQGKKVAALNPFKLPSILTPDPSSSLAQSLVLHGRTLDVVRAVTRDEAGKLKEEGERRREKADKRNMYLLREGVILPNSPAAHSITPTDLEKRTNSFNARRQLLKTNPALYVSKTRLSIRQVPTFVTERMLRKLANHSLKTFRDEVKAGKRRELSKDELHEDPVDTQEPEAKPPLSKKPAEDDGSASDGDDDGESKGKKSKRDKSWKKHSGVKQAKLVRMQERIDPVTLKGKSKGYGFLEMYKHADSLRVLRWANNNVDVGPLFEKWWKDDLEMMVKSETDKVKTMKKGGKGDEEVEQAESRLSKMKAELEAGAVRKAGKGSLIVEFSIENVQVVQRRTTRDENSRKRQPKDGQEEERPSKKTKLSKTKPAPATTKAPVKKQESVQPANPLGSMIGRKRKQRQAKRG